MKFLGILPLIFGLGFLISACQSAQENTGSDTTSPELNFPSATYTLTKNVLPTVQISTTSTSTSTSIPPTLTPTKIQCTESSGFVEEILFPSQLLNEDILANIYLPPCYDPDQQEGYPFLVLLHGQNGNQNQWIEIGFTNLVDELISTEKIPPMVIIMPFERQYLIDPKRSLYDEALVQDLLPQLLDSYNLRNEWQYRAIGGLSRGGNWALYIAFKHPDAFGRVAAHSYPGFAGDIFRVQTWVEQSVSAYRPALWFDIGEYDQYRKYGEPIIHYLQESGLPLEYTVYEGGHTIEYWKTHIHDYLAWYTKEW